MSLSCGRKRRTEWGYFPIEQGGGRRLFGEQGIVEGGKEMRMSLARWGWASYLPGAVSARGPRQPRNRVARSSPSRRAWPPLTVTAPVLLNALAVESAAWLSGPETSCESSCPKPAPLSAQPFFLSGQSPQLEGRIVSQDAALNSVSPGLLPCSRDLWAGSFLSWKDKLESINF